MKFLYSPTTEKESSAMNSTFGSDDGIATKPQVTQNQDTKTSRRISGRPRSHNVLVVVLTVKHITTWSICPLQQLGREIDALLEWMPCAIPSGVPGGIPSRIRISRLCGEWYSEP